MIFGAKFLAKTPLAAEVNKIIIVGTVNFMTPFMANSYFEENFRVFEKIKTRNEKTINLAVDE